MGGLREIGCGGVWGSYTTASMLHTERFILIWVWFVQDLDVLPIVPDAAGRSRDDDSGKTNSFTKFAKPFLCVPACDPQVTPFPFLFCFPVHYFTLAHLSRRPCPELLSNR